MDAECIRKPVEEIIDALVRRAGKGGGPGAAPQDASLARDGRNPLEPAALVHDPALGHGGLGVREIRLDDDDPDRPLREASCYNTKKGETFRRAVAHACPVEDQHVRARPWLACKEPFQCVAERTVYPGIIRSETAES